jgi:transcription initiation factor TFIID subunit 12
MNGQQPAQGQQGQPAQQPQQQQQPQRAQQQQNPQQPAQPQAQQQQPSAAPSNPPSNPPAQSQAPAQQQPAQQPRQIMFRPEHMRNLPSTFKDVEKTKWENGLSILYKTIESHPPDHPQAQNARKKIHDFSVTLQNKLREAQRAGVQIRGMGPALAQATGVPMQGSASQQGGQAGAGGAAAMQASASQQGQPQGQQQQQAQPQAQPTGQQPGQQAKPTGPSTALMNHVNNFPYVPPNPAGTPEAAQWIKDKKMQYMKALMAMESASKGLKQLQMTYNNLKAAGGLTEEQTREYNEQKAKFEKGHTDANRYVTTFRAQQAGLLKLQNEANGGAAAAAAGTQAQQTGQQNAPTGQQPGQQHQGPPTSIAIPPRPQLNLQQPATQAIQNTEAVRAAMQAAQRPANQTLQQQAQAQAQAQQQQSLQNQQQNVNQNVNDNAQNVPQQQPNIKQENGGVAGPQSVPQINTNLPQAPHIQAMQAQAQVQAQQRAAAVAANGGMGVNSPHSAGPGSAGGMGQAPGGMPQQMNAQAAQGNMSAPQSATLSATMNGPPRPLTHGEATTQAARTYSSSQTVPTPNVMASAAHSHPHLQRDVSNPAVVKQSMMPIPKHLPERAIGTPQAVNMPASRPSYSGGPSGSGMGVMQQPVVARPPSFVVEGEAERVLNKRKLDELVRQVTGGGGEVEGGEGLSADVEDVSLDPILVLLFLFPWFPSNSWLCRVRCSRSIVKSRCLYDIPPIPSHLPHQNKHTIL